MKIRAVGLHDTAFVIQVVESWLEQEIGPPR